MDTRAIGVMDSGLGGLTAVREISRIMPAENIVYFGDTGRVPYGSRSRETIIKYARQDIAFLRSFDLKAIVVACGTVSSNALDVVCPEHDIPIIGVVNSAAKAAAQRTRNGRIGVIATQSTIKSGAYTAAIHAIRNDVQIFEAACPLFVPLVENGRFHPGDVVIETVAREYLAPMIAHEIDTLILGCTHYPLLHEIIGEIMGPSVSLIDSGAESAKHIQALLRRADQLADPKIPGHTAFYVSDAPESFSKHAALFLGSAQPLQASKINIETIRF